ncbi:MAG: TetR/AcrR family transcriptional regulator [Mycobacterium sp.]
MADWLAANRSDAAAQRILDAAEELFARHDPASVGMNDIAKASGCSRATLYRYFENRDALYTAYVHREAHRVFRELGEQVTGIGDPHTRLVEGIVAALRQVRESPALSSWFAPTQRPIGGEMAERSEVIKARTEAYLAALGVEDVERRARWLLRVMVSLLVFPGHDEAEERAMLEEFVLPTVMPTTRQSTS